MTQMPGNAQNLGRTQAIIGLYALQPPTYVVAAQVQATRGKNNRTPITNPLQRTPIINPVLFVCTHYKSIELRGSMLLLHI
jgi:hypothetical protein